MKKENAQKKASLFLFYFFNICVQMTQHDTYDFCLRTASYDVSPTNSDSLLVYFKGDQGLTQTIHVPLDKLKNNIYENTFDLIDVGNVR